jgi:hypothetical protein
VAFFDIFRAGEGIAHDRMWTIPAVRERVKCLEKEVVSSSGEVVPKLRYVQEKRSCTQLFLNQIYYREE